MKPLLFALLLVIAVALIPVGVSAQENNSTDSPQVEISLTSGSDSDDSEEFEAIDNSTRLLSSALDGSTMVLRIDSDRRQRVTITDATGVLDGGEVDRESVILSEGINRVRFPVTVRDGVAAVTIDTGGVLYAVPVRTGSPLIAGPFGKTDVQTAGVAGIVSGVAVTGLIAFRRVRGISDSPERVL